MKIKFCYSLINAINFEPESIQPCCNIWGLDAVPSLPFTGGEVDMQAYTRHIHWVLADLQNKSPLCAGCPNLMEGEAGEGVGTVQFPPIQFRTVSINQHRELCNLRCVYCEVWKPAGSPGYAILPALKSLWQQQALHSDCTFHWGGGEPSILAEFEEASRWVSGKGFWQHVATNALKYSPAIAEILASGKGDINVSLDAADRATYQAVKGTDSFDLVVKNLRRYIGAAKDRSAIGLKYIIFDLNNSLDSIDAFFALCNDLGVTNVQLSFDFRDINNNKLSDASLVAAHRYMQNARRLNMQGVLLYVDAQTMLRLQNLAQPTPVQSAPVQSGSDHRDTTFQSPAMREHPLEIRNYCPVCDTRNFRWHPLPNYYLNAWRKCGFKQSGACEMTPIHTYLCSCGASDRERLYAFFLREVMQSDEVFANKEMIHFAPEPALSRHIRQRGYFAAYQTADFSMPGVDYQVDLQALPFADDHFDCFICSHVLEHVPDDRAAIRELYRVTRPGGFGILMAPVFRVPQTLEDPSITDAIGRWRLFGQNDHLRLYSHDDYVRKIEESGFLLHQLTEKDFGADVFRQLGLKPSSILYVVSKPPAQAAEKASLPVDAAIARLQNRAFKNNPAEGQENTPPKVTVILTSYNHDGFLDEAIESVLAQTYRNFELIIWDDASSDDSWTIIEQYDDPRILSFRNEFNRYGIYGVNKAINEVARGEYIAIHHSDDVWELEKLEKQVAFLDQHPETGAVFSWANIMDVEGNFTNDVNLYQIFRQENKTRHEWLRQLYRYNGLCHPSVLIRKQCYTDCGLYNPALRQLPDMEMWIRLCFKYEIHVLPEDLVRFRWSASGSNTSSLLRDSIYRQMVEGYMMLDNYRQIASLEDLVKIFPAAEKYCAHPDADLEFALAMTAFESGGLTPHALLSLKWLYNLMASPEKAEKIRAIHHFDYLDFANLTGQVQIFAERQPATVPPISVSVAPLERGIQAFNHENYEAAIECLSTAMTEEPENPLPAAYLAFICAQQGLVQEARDFIAQAKRLAPERADLIAALGEVLLKSNRPLEAVEYLRDAIHIQPDLFAAYPALAQSLHLTGQSAEAIALLQTASIIPSDAQANIQTTLTQIQAEST